jgi:hypothetical protein
MKKLLLLLTLAFPLSHAAEFTLHESNAIVMDGEIVAGDSAKLYQLLSTGKTNGVIALQSLGGDVSEALLLATMISTYRMSTIVSTGCYSACSFVFMSASKKFIYDTGEVGTHVPHLKLANDVYEEQARSATWWSLYGLIRGSGLDDKQAKHFLDKTYVTSYKDLYIINKKNAAEFGVVFKEKLVEEKEKK